MTRLAEIGQVSTNFITSSVFLYKKQEKKSYLKTRSSFSTGVCRKKITGDVQFPDRRTLLGQVFNFKIKENETKT